MSNKDCPIKENCDAMVKRLKPMNGEDEIDRLHDALGKAMVALDTLVKKNIANIDKPESQFVSCCTPDKIPDHWKEAMQICGYKVRTYE